MKLPELPTFEATWWPVWLETVPGSGECINVAVVVQPNGMEPAQVRQIIQPATLRTMFGEAGAGMQVVVGETVLALDEQLRSGARVEQLDMPFGGQGLGRGRDCVAHDVNEIFEVATRLAGAFGRSQFGVVEKSPTESQRAFDEWAEKVRAQLLANEQKDQWAQAFNVRVNTSNRRALRVGFFLNSYVAQLGVLRPGRSISADVRALKLKMFDLDVLRRDQLLPFKRAELLVGCSELSDNYPRRQQETLAESWRFIQHEAMARNVGLVRCESAAAAAQHLQKIAA